MFTCITLAKYQAQGTSLCESGASLRQAIWLDRSNSSSVLFSVVIATTSLTQISPYFQNFASACSAASELFKIIDRRSSIDPFDESGLRLEKINGELEFKNVDFSYPTRPNVPVLQSFSLVFPARKTTAIVGASGSGKSTIVGLLERWYDINSGTVLIDGQKIEDINISWLRTRIRLVQQEPVLFNGTVFENVCYGLMGSELVNESEEEKMNLVIEACKIANAHEFVSELPEVSLITNMCRLAHLLTTN